ncbi:dihydroorotate dehydrogenase [Candidatus Gracilibacteria bacterium]|nr:dihydroorotate dehydrogenase [Candidatus Gracilibacteria bacterium]
MPRLRCGVCTRARIGDRRSTRPGRDRDTHNHAAASSGAARPGADRDAAGLLYCGGMQNPGLRNVVERFAPSWEHWQVQVIVSIAGESVQEYREIAEHLEGLSGVAAIEIPLYGYSVVPVDEAGRVIDAVRRACQLPIIAKIGLSGIELASLVATINSAGADALSISAGVVGMASDPADGVLREGQLCGPALRPLALTAAVQACAASQLPVIAGGGISGAEDAEAFLHLGASAISIGSALVRDPRTAATIHHKLVG